MYNCIVLWISLLLHVYAATTATTSSAPSTDLDVMRVVANSLAQNYNLVASLGQGQSPDSVQVQLAADISNVIKVANSSSMDPQTLTKMLTDYVSSITVCLQALDSATDSDPSELLVAAVGNLNSLYQQWESSGQSSAGNSQSTSTGAATGNNNDNGGNNGANSGGNNGANYGGNNGANNGGNDGANSGGNNGANYGGNNGANNGGALSLGVGGTVNGAINKVVPTATNVPANNNVNSGSKLGIGGSDNTNLQPQAAPRDPTFLVPGANFEPQ